MKKFLTLPVFLLALTLTACGGSEGGSSSSTPTSDPTSEPTSEPEPTFDAYTLSQLHDARVADELSSLDRKLVSIKGKATFVKRVNETYNALFIQSGKFGLEVTYPEPYEVNVGDSVEAKGKFVYTKTGDVGTIFLSTFQSENSYYDVKVINEVIETETPVIKTEADLIEYDSSYASMNFKVVEQKTNAAFVGNLDEEGKKFIVANKLGLAEKFPEPPYEINDGVNYEGVYTYSGDSSARVIRYLDKEGFRKLLA